MTKEELITFEEDIKRDFLAGKIRYPVHFSAGNEEQLIKIFEENDIANPDNWIFSTHRSHLHALLKGIPKEWIKEQIHHGNSMHLMSPEYKFFSSAIVGGCCPIAVGTTMGIKRKGLKGRVWCFVGDMASESGIFYESHKYAANFDLPITFVIEDNGLSTNSPTSACWNAPTKDPCLPKVIYYKYERLCPHINAGVFVEFK